MNDKDRKPEKIDVEKVLGPDAAGPADGGDIEVLDPGTGAPAGAAAAPEAVATAMAEREKYYDLWIRARADFENYRKRIEREREEERVQAGAALARDLLPALDNLERALAGAAAGDPFHDGVALISRQLRESLARAGLAPIEAIGVPFNPVYHEAVMTEATGRFEPNTVLEEIQKGYLFRGRVLRPALVKVSVKPEQTVPGDAAASEEPGGASGEA